MPRVLVLVFDHLATLDAGLQPVADIGGDDGDGQRGASADLSDGFGIGRRRFSASGSGQRFLYPGFPLALALPILLGNLLWLNAVSKLGLVFSALYMNLVPTTTVIISAAFDNRPTTTQLAGGAIVLAGIMLAQLPDKWILMRSRAPP